MKKHIILLLLFSFLYQNTSSFWIITSFYLNQEYISDNLCVNRFDAIPMCYGSCYLQDELAQDSDKKTELPLLKTKEIQPLFLQSIAFDMQEVQPIPVDAMQYTTETISLVVQSFVFSVFQPPERV
ncbi:hypothetical protein [Myroides sp. WP-1]|uniref:hypothetical protein n=1 Tax=Myroides sp. WP-1 TaxID=2759944 RepID=UPI0015FE30D3|nr:hypothetical protein [Myroides sp. WP-1]MBB1138062.1 hypothetical protein [Myroides sp. WP-1]